ncbi:MAG: 30S ribosomal protein S1 [Anaerolineae bacterium]|nr:30S ribosomal protein S1 [Anaerolineae bacterium]
MVTSTNEELAPQKVTSIEQLQPKMYLEGVVKKVELYGAFVDIGLDRDGLIHISQLSDERIKKVSDVVKEGDRVNVWVTSVDTDNGRIGLTMLKPPDLPWKDLEKGQTHTGRVTRIERYGVFVDFGAERPGLLHVREMGHRFVRNPSELFSLDDEVEVRIQELDRRKKRIDLTMVDLAEAAPETGSDEEEPVPTHMAIAFHMAQQKAGQQPKKQRAIQRKSSRRQQAEQDDILSRTLGRHRQ